MAAMLRETVLERNWEAPMLARQMGEKATADVLHGQDVDRRTCDIAVNLIATSLWVSCIYGPTTVLANEEHR